MSTETIVPSRSLEVTPNSEPWQEELRIDELTLDAALQMREGIDDAAVERYRIAYAEGERMPPLGVVSTGEQYFVIDGFHRVRAAKQAGLHNLDCHIREGSRGDAFRFALGMNRTHGLPRSRVDTRKAIGAALTNTETRRLSDRAIAELVGCTNKTVASVRSELAATEEIPRSAMRVGLDGRTINTDRIGSTEEIPQSDEEFIDVEEGINKEFRGREKSSNNISSPPEEEVTNQSLVVKYDAPVKRFIRAATQLRESFAVLADANEFTAHHYNSIVEQDFDIALKNAKNVITARRPHVTCPCCNGIGCDECHRLGVMTRGEAGLVQ